MLSCHRLFSKRSQGIQEIGRKRGVAVVVGWHRVVKGVTPKRSINGDVRASNPGGPEARGVSRGLPTRSLNPNLPAKSSQ